MGLAEAGNDSMAAPVLDPGPSPAAVLADFDLRPELLLQRTTGALQALQQLGGGLPAAHRLRGVAGLVLADGRPRRRRRRIGDALVQLLAGRRRGFGFPLVETVGLLGSLHRSSLRLG